VPLPTDPSSYWLDRRAKRRPTAPLEGDREADVVIVGAGIVGAYLALCLAADEVEVVLLDADEPGRGATGRNAGFLLDLCARTGGYLLILPWVLSEVFVAFNHATLSARIAICVACITPAGLLLGFGFPTGMRLIAAIDSRPTPWFWGINGAAGVLASIVAVVVSLALGITTTLILGALCYFLLIPVSVALFQPTPIKLSKKPAR
jgi:hypothetical protein